MEIDIYEKSNHESSISNLIMLKAFHDAGVDVYSFNIKDYFVDIQYSYDCSFDILESGCNKLFDEVKTLDFYELEDTDMENYQHLFTDDNPEQALIIRDSLITDILSSSFKDDFFTFIKEQSKKVSYSDTEIYCDPRENILIVEVFFPGMLHEIAIGLIHILKRAEKLKKKLEEFKKNGISNKDNREVA